MGRQRDKLGSWQCGRVGRHMLTTSQGNESQNEPQHQQGVTRPQLILALVSAEILRMRSRSPSSGRTKSTLMLVKRLSLWWREVFLKMYCLPQIAGNERWEVVRRLSVFWGVLVHRKIRSPARKKKNWREDLGWTPY